MRKGVALIVDDSGHERRRTRDVLGALPELGEVIEAEDGLTALRLLATRPIDVVVCDLTMPRCDGVQFLRLRGAKTELARVPVLVSTAATDIARRIELFEAGAADYVTKPWDPRELAARVLVHLRSRLMQEELERLNHQLGELACRDALTSVHNRRHFDVVLRAEVERFNRYGTALALVLVDVDHFKAINDGCGHPVGDLVLRRLADVLLQRVRKADVVARYGGEEFALVLPSTGLAGALILAERLRQAVAEIEHHHAAVVLRVTASFGVALAIPAPGALTSAHQLVEQADQALYQAKQGGRNRVVVWEAPGP